MNFKLIQISGRKISRVLCEAAASLIDNLGQTSNLFLQREKTFHGKSRETNQNWPSAVVKPLSHSLSHSLSLSPPTCPTLPPPASKLSFFHWCYHPQRCPFSHPSFSLSISRSHSHTPALSHSPTCVRTNTFTHAHTTTFLLLKAYRFSNFQQIKSCRLALISDLFSHLKYSFNALNLKHLKNFTNTSCFRYWVKQVSKNGGHIAQWIAFSLRTQWPWF